MYWLGPISFMTNNDNSSVFSSIGPWITQSGVYREEIPDENFNNGYKLWDARDAGMEEGTVNCCIVYVY